MSNFKVIKELLKAGNEICMPVKGSSMAPFLKNKKDYVYATKPTFPLKTGDIAFFEDRFGRSVMHRVCKKTEAGYYFCGDAMNSTEGPIQESAVFAKVTGVVRDGKRHSIDGMSSKLFAVRARVKKLNYGC